MKAMTAPRQSVQAKLLRDLRIALDLSQAEFAARADLTPSLYNMYETGKRRLTLDSALLIRQAFDVPLDYLYGGHPAGLPARIRRRLPGRVRDLNDDD